MSSSSDGGGEKREEELRIHVAQLKEELEREKAEKRQLHQENEQCEKMNKEFQAQIKSIEKRNEDHINKLKLTHSKEKQELAEKLREKLCEEAEEVLTSRFESERRKMQHEMFGLQQHIDDLEAKNADLVDGDRNTAAVLRDVDKKHKNEIEMLNKQHRLATRKQMEELEAMNRKISNKEREMAKLTEQLSRIDADRDKLQDEIKRLKQAESWTRRSSTPPSLSPSSSMNDLVSKRERDMVMKNSELSFRVRKLEDDISKLRTHKNELQKKLTESRQQLAPLEQQKIKLGHRINDLNASLRSREKKIEQMAKTILELKISKQQLEEENSRHKKSLQQQLSQNSAHRTEREKLRSKNVALSQSNTSLSDELETLRSENKDLQDRLMFSSPPVSPSHPVSSPLSPCPSSPVSSLGDDSSLSSSAGSSILLEQLDQLQFDKEESEVKYEEMKSEYVALRDKYKQLVSKYEDLQSKYKDQQAKNRLLREQLQLLKKEHMDLEHEVVLLRKSEVVSPSHDVRRFDLLQKELAEKERKICELEDFIVEQDEVAQTSEKVLMREKKDLQLQLTELSKTNDSLSTEMDVLSQKVGDLEEELEEAKERSKAKDTEHQESIDFSEPHMHSEEYENVMSGSPLSSAQLEKCVLQYKNQIQNLEDKNTSLQRDFEDAVSQVTQLQSLVMELEGQIEVDGRAHSEEVADRDEEIDHLNQRLTQLETKIVKIKRSLPTEFDQSEAKELADQVLEATYRVKQATDQKSSKLRMEVKSLEDTVNKLVQAVIPDYVPRTPEMNFPVDINGEDEQLLSEEESETPTPSSQTQQVSSNFTELPMTYEKVKASEKTHALLAMPDSLQKTSAHSSTVTESTDGPFNVPLGLPLMFASQPMIAEQESIDKSVQTTQSATRDDYSQTPSAKGHNRMTQTLSLRKSDHSTQTGYIKKTVTAEKSSQTFTIQKPKTTDSSCQTHHVRKPVSLEDLTLHTNSKVSGNSSQLSKSGKLVMDHSSSPLLLNGWSSPANERANSDWKRSPACKKLPTYNHLSQRSTASPFTVEEESRNVSEAHRVFVAVMDYEPNSLCTTGRPEMELCFHTGDVLSVEGDMNESGYYLASFGGKSGLVPANFIQEAEVTDLAMRERLFNQSLSHNLSTGSCRSSPFSISQQLPLSPYQIPKELTCPQSPLSFHIEKVVGHSGLLVAWQPPPMDSMCRSNGCLVTGYQLYVNGETKTLVSGALQSRTLLTDVSLAKPLRLGISTSSVEGKSSNIMEIAYSARPVSISSTSPEPEHCSMYVALYDYDPMKCSPSDNPEFELSFKEGDFIKIYGKEKDGFLVGELNGKQGWVPATFVDLVRGPTEKCTSPATLSPLHKSLSHTAAQLKSRRMVALYDYDPVKVSPNPNPEAELSFKAGDIITIFGNMLGDGFYSGELKGKFGLVPSNFIQKLP